MPKHTACTNIKITNKYFDIRFIANHNVLLYKSGKGCAQHGVH